MTTDAPRTTAAPWYLPVTPRMSLPENVQKTIAARLKKKATAPRKTATPCPSPRRPPADPVPPPEALLEDTPLRYVEGMQRPDP